ncbi:MAG: tetratricopeptide repeat protein, partial [Bryobacteraceae bacterium]
MATRVLDLLTTAIDLQKQGQYPQAESIYHQILDHDRRQPDALHLLGLLSHQMGQYDKAIDYIQRAITLNSRVAPFHNNLGNALASLGRLDDALRSYERALAIEASPDAHLNLGNLLQQLGRYEDAIAHYRAAGELPETHNNAGNALVALGRHAEALESFGRALRLRPDYPEAHLNLGLAHLAAGDTASAAVALEASPLAEAKAALAVVHLQRRAWADAEQSALEALRARPGYPEAWVNLGRALHEQWRFAEAETAARIALSWRSSMPEAWNNLGMSLHHQDRVDESDPCFRQALALDPGFFDAHYNLGNSLRARRGLDEAVAAYDAAVALRPEDANAHWNRALTRLWKGDWQAGFEEYEWRWRRAGTPPRDFSQPLWDGAPLDGRTILLHAEQGLGDTIQFLRYAPLVKARGGRVVVECPPALVPLVARVEGVEAAIPAGAALPPFSTHAPLLTLPHLFGTRPDSVPPPIRLFAEPLAGLALGKEKLVGIAWAGNPEHPNNHRRSIPPALLAPLSRIPGVRLVSLQKDTAPGPELITLDSVNTVEG